MDKLIILSLQSIDISMVMVVNALDELKYNEPPSAILSALGRLVEQIHRVRFFVTGGLEAWIKAGFRLLFFKASTGICHASVAFNLLRSVTKSSSSYELPDHKGSKDGRASATFQAPWLS
jgi:hypothetical protein